MSQHAWFEHFKEKLQGLTGAFEQSGTFMSLLGFALKEKHLSSEDYLKWAMTHYRLPFLQAKFFTETPPSPEMFNKWATHYPWSVECLPVAEWDGSLIVACIQPPQDFPSFPQSILVLASLECMEQTWKKYHPELAKPVVAVAATPAAEEVPEGIDLSVVTPGKKSSDSFSFDDLNVNEEVAEVIVSDEEKESPLEGLFEGLTVTKLEALTPPSTTGLIKTDSVVVEVAADTKVPTSTLTSIPTAGSPLVTLKSTEAATTIAPMPVAATPKPDIPAPPQKTEPVVAASATTPPPPIEDSFSNKPIPLVPRPAGVAKPTLNPVANGTFSLDKLKKKNTTLLTERVKTTLSEMKTHFEKSMILTLDDLETQATAFAWDENFKGMKDTSVRVPLKTPSIFNIVAATSKPFHGYVSLNEINEKFFEDWNQGRIPDHVTIAPILINDKLVGMLVGFAEKAAYNRTSLNLVEKLSTEFVKGLQAA
ncbi:dihydrolipoyllysine-residue succinyltransferase component of 2-oxoglutarate dehydrogenase complex [Bdellovibrio svalbardensis]|uniref:GAF domain-containing protein n=1 Tax=Bdellovibrio svalbardensis TaxID=2972972 RepID=A0ABT6DJI2_9BACT|nr:hypothetical protein [Bdellovibrio svalbardensis]MDG0816669.1 hypothetical protein [Bdellovibrio svalbardensis]